MRIDLHIGLEQAATLAVQRQLSNNRAALQTAGILYPVAPGKQAHTRLFMAVTEPDNIDALRQNRGIATPRRQAKLRETLSQKLAQEIDAAAPSTMILSAAQLGTGLRHISELQRLRDLLHPFASSFRIISHVDDPARLLLRHYETQVLEGRAAPLERDLSLLNAPDWWQACAKTWEGHTPQCGHFSEIQGAPFWLNFTRLQQHWEQVFGDGTFEFHTYASPTACAPFTDQVRFAHSPADVTPPPSAAYITRARQLNALILQVLAKENTTLARKDWRSVLKEVSVAGPPSAAGSLAAVSARFASANAALLDTHAGLRPETFTSDVPLAEWREADPTRGYRATQYLLAFRDRITPTKQDDARPNIALSDQARAVMPPLAQKNHAHLQNTPLRPHNRIGSLDEAQFASQYTAVAPRSLPSGNSGRVIVSCMKNEAPYVLEWIAYHRAIGVDNFLIYTNDCSDGTDDILDQLQTLGIVQHRRNDNWKGNSPQQHALNQSLSEPMIQNAEWIIHIDLDEFINVRCGNGTLQDFLDRVPDATNVAMTWRLFGHNGVTALNSQFVTQQFDHCAPKFCPKPHTVWGYKTMTKNIGAYAKISCHRPNKLHKEARPQVRWVNGSGRDMTDEAIDNGWRNSRKSIGYDLLQLNHYALRSTESFLIKRQRGRALHVDRSIGLNYWIRMDWCDHRDVTIQRNSHRLTAAFNALLADDKLRMLHEAGQKWHHRKAQALRKQPEFSALFEQTQTITLNSLERAAYALALDMES